MANEIERACIEATSLSQDAAARAKALERAIRIVISDEAAEQKRDEDNPAKGDVPVWFDYTWFTTDDAVMKCRAAVESEIARRVEAATADLRRERDEWERRWNERNAKVVELHEECQHLAKELKEREDEISELHQPPPAIHSDNVVEVCVVCAELKSDLMHADNRVRSCERREADLRRQLSRASASRDDNARVAVENGDKVMQLEKKLAAARAEVERLKETAANEKKLRVEYQSIVYEACRLLDEKTHPPDCTIDKVSDRIMNLRKKLGDAWKEIESLNSEVARLSRPGDDADLLSLKNYLRHVCPENREWAVDLIQRERNAREAAEARERKLREFVKTRVCGPQEIERQWIPLTEYDLDRLLAAFDEEGAKQ